MEGICGGFFQSSPLSIALSLDDDGNVKKRLCCNYSKEGPDSPSANSYVDPSKFPTKFDTPAKMAEIVSSSFFRALHILHGCSFLRFFALARPRILGFSHLRDHGFFARAQPFSICFRLFTLAQPSSIWPTALVWLLLSSLLLLMFFTTITIMAWLPPFSWDLTWICISLLSLIP